MIAIRENSFREFIVLAWEHLGRPADGAKTKEWFQAAFELGCDLTLKVFASRMYTAKYLRQVGKARWVYQSIRPHDLFI